MGGKPGTAEERFWRQVTKRGADECWEWTGGGHARGYGELFIRKDGERNVKARTHRFSYELHNGPIPAGMQVGHRCNNARCVNPRHLYITTNAGNVKDAWRDGIHPRYRNQTRGSAHPHAKLSEAQVRAIKRSLENGNTITALAREYDLALSTVASIRDGVTWGHVKASPRR